MFVHVQKSISIYHSEPHEIHDYKLCQLSNVFFFYLLQWCRYTVFNLVLKPRVIYCFMHFACPHSAAHLFPAPVPNFYMPLKSQPHTSSDVDEMSVNLPRRKTTVLLSARHTHHVCFFVADRNLIIPVVLHVFMPNICPKHTMSLGL